MDDDDLFAVVDQGGSPPPRESASPSDAPYGYKANGEPYKRRPAGGPRKVRAAKKDDRGDAVKVAVSSCYAAIIAVLTMLARMLKSTPLMADAIVVNKSASKTIPPLTEIISKNDQLVEMCVRLTAITPGIELAMALLPVIGQILSNHGMVPGAENQSEAIVRAHAKEQAEQNARDAADAAAQEEFANVGSG